MEFSKTQVNETLRRILMARLPGILSVDIAETSDDKQGTDFWAVRDLDQRDLSVDVKVRDVDPLEKYKADDLALETWSVCYSKVGWTRDKTKKTDYILWYWLPTGRFFIVPFHPLCKVFCCYWEEWAKQFRVWQQETTDEQTCRVWQSECVFVPRSLVMAKLNDWACGYLKVGS